MKIEGEIGRKYGVDWYSDDDVPTHGGTITTSLIAKDFGFGSGCR